MSAPASLLHCFPFIPPLLGVSQKLLWANHNALGILTLNFIHKLPKQLLGHAKIIMQKLDKCQSDEWIWHLHLKGNKVSLVRWMFLVKEQQGLKQCFLTLCEPEIKTYISSLLLDILSLHYRGHIPNGTQFKKHRKVILYVQSSAFLTVWYITTLAVLFKCKTNTEILWNSSQMQVEFISGV